ncbi:HNH/endonuclease VII fold putative polymorphic toxin [Salinispora arenicola]|uniref:Intein n=1 Tax=Salinispora arenicola TaxID=168697 RepID=A0A542XPW4_SALAC|nr:HNH/endonuclease VII fold putative polymorphic toxin [Salinispora arenicola]TQL37881.1 intein [Salinispora arenicola]
MVAAVVVLASLQPPSSVARAAESGDERAWVVADLLSGSPSVRRAAEAALLGSDEDVQAFLESGRAEAVRADERAAARVLAGMDGPAMRTAAQDALAGSDEDVSAFVEGGWKPAWAADERVRAFRWVESGGPTVRAAAEEALAGAPEELTEFLAQGRHAALFADDRLAVTRMLTGGVNNSGPVLDAAAQQALAGSAQDLREFVESGQFVARARDEELASVRSLVEQAKEAGETTSREALAATEWSGRASAAAQEAKEAAQEAAQEAAAAGGDAGRASAAAGRAADAARGAADAARDAVGASNAAMRAARVASDAARKATTAASLTARAAARAQRAAADARTDADKASAARAAAESARDAAAKAREMAQVRAERDRALAQAKAAATAAKSASANADAAAVAADSAAGHAGVSAEQAARSRAAAARAQQLASAAARAADRAYQFAVAAAKASEEAFDFAAQAAAHAEAAADAAEAAAEAAGDAANAAQESAKHAAAAVEAANTAVAAANRAVELETLARQEDETRLEEATEQGVLAAQEQLAVEQEADLAAGDLLAWNRELLWDTAEEDRVDPATRQLLDEATAADASTDVVLDRGRRAAVNLLTTGGEWTRAAAAEALAGGEVELRSWLTGGRRVAVGQDDRARVWHLTDVLPDGDEKVAAQAALAGDDAAVEQFLRTRDYPGKFFNDRLAIYRILGGAGPSVTTAAQQALSGSAADMHAFLRQGQHVARGADERLAVFQTMDAGGPQVKAAGQVALAGPASFVSYFLTVSRYQAAQRDQEQAAHVAAVKALIAEAQQYAQTALADAAEAQRVAADAAGKAAEAQAYAQQAIDAANTAAGHANDAADSASAAKASADQAAQSATTARNAAASAQASADKAAKSAATATAASERASVDAQYAYQAKEDARAAALAAGEDALAADLAAREAVSTYLTKVEEWEAARRSTEPGSGPDGTGTALDQYRTWGCFTDIENLNSDCAKVAADFASALRTPALCNVPANSGRPGCRMVGDLEEFVQENPDLMLDMLQFALMACGLAPVVGEACDGVDAAVSFSRGDWVGGFLSVGAMVPVAGWVATGAKGVRAEDKLRDMQRIADAFAKGCKKSSFIPGTKVLLADGTSTPIEKITTGDIVTATDTVNGTTTGKAVIATIASVGTKNLVDITIDTDGDSGTNTATITATNNHPFWLPEKHSWVPAGELTAGNQLRVIGSALAPITVIAKSVSDARVHNLTIKDLHTYYVLAGDIPVLVSNANCVPHTKWFPTRGAAFREAKRDLGIPNSQVHDELRITPMTNAQGKQIMNPDGTPVNTREYIFTRGDGSQVIIQDHSAGHYFNEGGVGDQGPHINVRPIDKPRNGKVPGTAQHYNY